MKKFLMLTIILTSSLLVVNCETKKSSTSETENATEVNSENATEVNSENANAVNNENANAVNNENANAVNNENANAVDSNFQPTSNPAALQILDCKITRYWFISTQTSYLLQTVYNLNNELIGSKLHRDGLSKAICETSTPKDTSCLDKLELLKKELTDEGYRCTFPGE